jgi:hypothetical protein
MDGAARRREMMESIKNQIKRGASARRETRALQRRRNGEFTFVLHLERDNEGIRESLSSTRETTREDRISDPGSLEFSTQGQQEDTARHMATPPTVPPAQSSINIHSLPVDDLGPIRSILDLATDGPQQHAGQPILTLGRAWELDFVMMYLDYVFPFLFPFYRPPLIGTGRTWLLSFLRQSDTVFHSVISLSAYFFIVALGDVFPGKHDNCKTIVWNQVLKQADLSFDMIQKDVSDVNSRREVGLLERVRLSENIIQLLIFESFLGRSTNWQMHLIPAIALFEEILEECSRSSPEKPQLLCVLEEMAWQSGSEQDFGRFIWNPDQSGFRFFTAILIFVDIIASTALGKAPQLSSYHSRILGDVKPEDVALPIDLSAFVGCQNWALVVIAEVAGLDAWKKNMKNAGSLSVPDLVQRASRISQNLALGLDKLDSSSSSLDSHPTSRFCSYYDDSGLQSTSMCVLISRIWAHAAQIYLFVVVSGWQPAHSEVRRSIEQILILLQHIRAPAQMRALAWPICVAGCLADNAEYEEGFRSLMARATQHGSLSTFHEVQGIMEEVWMKRNSLNRDIWDITASLQVLGSPTLLV